MSNALIRRLTCANDDDDGPAQVQAAPAALPAVVASDDPPLILKQFARLLVQQNLIKDILISRVTIRASLRVLESDVRKGQIGYTQRMELLVDDVNGGDPSKWWESVSNPSMSLPYALGVMLTSYDAAEMPIDTQISLRGFQTEHELRMGVRATRDTSCRDHIMLGNTAVPTGSPAVSLLTRPLVCTEPLTGKAFGSVEAIGFSSKQFWKLVVRVADKKTASVARLFTRTTYEPASDVHHSDSAPRNGYSLVPLSYRFTSLIERVHVYLTLQRIRRESVYEILPEAIDPSTYELPTTSTHLIFETNALVSAVRFIDERLVDVHPTFQPSELHATIEPLQYDSWTEAWEARENMTRSLNAVATTRGEVRRRVPYSGENKSLSCQVCFVIYYAIMRQNQMAAIERYITDADADTSSLNEDGTRDQPIAATPRKPLFLGTVDSIDDSKHESMHGSDGKPYVDWNKILPATALVTTTSSTTAVRTASVTTDSSDEGEDGELMYASAAPTPRGNDTLDDATIKDTLPPDGMSSTLRSEDMKFETIAYE